MGDTCADRQQWLLENNDGSQVICLCQVEDSQKEDIQNDGKVVAKIDVGIQTPPLKRSSSPPIPNAPKRVWKCRTFQLMKSMKAF